MPIAFIGGVGANNGASGSSLTTASYTVSAGSLLVAVWRHLHDNVAGSGTPAVTISDSRGNTWANATSETIGVANAYDGIRAGIAYAMNATSGSTTFTFTIADSRQTRGIAVLEYSGAATASALVATAGAVVVSGATVTSSTYSTSGNTLTVGVASTLFGGNLTDWTGLTVAGNASTGRSPAAYDTLAYIRDYISTSPFSSVTSSASNNNSVTNKLIVSASFAEAPSVTYTYARPTSDITTQWTPSAGTDHYALIDEPTASDADYIYATAAGQTDEVRLASMTAPKAGTDVLINYRVTNVVGTSKVTVSLICNTAVIATDTIRTAAGDYTLTVPSTTWSTVADWSNMRLRFVSS